MARAVTVSSTVSPLIDTRSWAESESLWIPVRASRNTFPQIALLELGGGEQVKKLNERLRRRTEIGTAIEELVRDAFELRREPWGDKSDPDDH